MQRQQSAWRNGKKRCSVAAKPAGRGEFGETAVRSRGRRPCQVGRAVPRAVGWPQRQLSACGGGGTGSRSARAANRPRQRLATPTCAVRCASCTRAPGITSRAAGRARLRALPAPSSRPPEAAVPAEGRRRHAAGPPAHTRAGECWALVGSGERRGHQASSTCAGRSRRVTARRSGPAAPPAPGGKPPGRRTPSAARPPTFPPDLDLRHGRRHEEDQLLSGEGQLVATARAPRRSNYRRSERVSRTTSKPGAHTSRGGNRAHRGPPAAAEPPWLTDGAEEREPPLRATAGSFLQTGAATAGGLSWATAAAIRGRGAAAAAAPGVTAR